jgi:hypothetical protein
VLTTKKMKKMTGDYEIVAYNELACIEIAYKTVQGNETDELQCLRSFLDRWILHIFLNTYHYTHISNDSEFLRSITLMVNPRTHGYIV